MKVSDWRHRFDHGARTGPVVLVCLALALGLAHAEPAIEIEMVDGQVSVRAVDVPLRAVLEALAAEGVVEVHALEALSSRVDIDTGPVTRQAMLYRLLRHRSYLLLQGPDEAISRLWILSSGRSSVAAEWRAVSPDVATLARARFDLTDPDPEVREEAVFAVGNIGGDLAVALLAGSTADAAPGVREAAAAVLEDLDATDYLSSGRLTD